MASSDTNSCDVSSNVGSYHWWPAAPRGNSPWGKVEGQRSRDKTKVKGQVSPPSGKVMNQCRPLADRSCTSGALLRTSHELVLSKFVHLTFF